MLIKEKVPEINYDSMFETLHGHVCIDLHNHNSGFTERIEADNLVTNAIKTLFPSFVRGGASGLSAFFPIYQKALGGLMLFDTALTQDANNILFPNSAHLIGFAGQTQNTEEAMQGSFNVAESGEITGGYRTVWDFGTNQGNGVIAALARTHANVSNGPVAEAINISNTVSGGVQGHVRYFDSINRYIYVINNTAVKTIPFSWDGIDVVMPFPDYSSMQDTGMTVSESRLQYAQNGHDGYLHYPYISSTGSGTDRIYLVEWKKIKVSDGSFEESWEAYHQIRDDSLISTLDSHNFAATNGYGYIFNSSYSKIYKLNLSNNSDITAIPLTHSNHRSMRGLSNGVVYLINGAQEIIYPDNTVICISTKTANELYQQNHLNIGSSRDLGSYNSINSLIRADYLGTIANISPVSKTASQSMKITYTLTTAA